MVKHFLPTLLFSMIFAAACSQSENKTNNTTDSASDTASDGGTDTGSDTNTDIDTDADADSNSDSNSDSDSGSDTDSNSDSDLISSDSDTGANDTGSTTDADTASDSTADTGTDTHIDTDEVTPNNPFDPGREDCSWGDIFSDPDNVETTACICDSGAAGEQVMDSWWETYCLCDNDADRLTWLESSLQIAEAWSGTASSEAISDIPVMIYFREGYFVCARMDNNQHGFFYGSYPADVHTQQYELLGINAGDTAFGRVLLFTQTGSDIGEWADIENLSLNLNASDLSFDLIFAGNPVIHYQFHPVSMACK